MRTRVVYLASPYSHNDPAVRQSRYESAVAAAAELMRRHSDVVVISPIVASHPLALRLGGDCNGIETWQELDKRLIALCDELCILTLPGWMESRGISLEEQWAEDYLKRVWYWDGQE